MILQIKKRENQDDFQEQFYDFLIYFAFIKSHLMYNLQSNWLVLEFTMYRNFRFCFLHNFQKGNLYVHYFARLQYEREDKQKRIRNANRYHKRQAQRKRKSLITTFVVRGILKKLLKSASVLHPCLFQQYYVKQCLYCMYQLQLQLLRMLF